MRCSTCCICKVTLKMDTVPNMSCELRTRMGWSQVKIYGPIGADVCVIILGNSTHTSYTFHNVLNQCCMETFGTSVCFLQYNYIHSNGCVHGLEGYAMQLEDILCDVDINPQQFHGICLGFGVAVMMKYTQSPRKYTIENIACLYPDPKQYLPNQSNFLCCCPQPLKKWQMYTVKMPPLLDHNVHMQILFRWYQFAEDVRDGFWFVVEDPRESHMGKISAKYMGVHYNPIMTSDNHVNGQHECIHADMFSIIVSILSTLP